MSSILETPLRVLIVEDEQLLALFLVDVLEDLGCIIVGTASSGEEAFKTAEQGFDLAFVDIGLAGAMDGIDTAHQLREQFGGTIVFTSGASGAEVTRRTDAIAPLAFLLKPFGPAEVEAVVARAVERRGR